MTSVSYVLDLKENAQNKIGHTNFTLEHKLAVSISDIFFKNLPMEICNKSYIKHPYKMHTK